MSAAKKEEFRYLIASRHDRRWGLFVPGVGYSLNQQSGAVDPAHPSPYFHVKPNGRVLPEYQLIYVTRGQGFFESEVTPRQPLAAGNLFLLFPGVWHCFDACPQTDWDLHWISASGDYFHQLARQRIINRRSPVLQVGLDETVFATFRRAWNLAECNPPGLQPLLASAAIEILAATMAARSTERQTDVGPIVRQAVVILKSRSQEVVDMESLAQSLGVGYDRFRHLFHTETGMGPYQYHLRLRIGRAQELLRTTTMTIKTVAESLGFDDPYHFSKIFKEKTGYSPAQWRGRQASSDSPR